MIPARALTLIMALFLLQVNAFPQNFTEDLVIIGNVYDDSLHQLSYVAISLNGKPEKISDANGHFSLTVQHSDTIDFSCTGFETARMMMGGEKITDDTIFIEVVMRPKIYDIRAAEILPYNNYEEFRSALINHDYDLNADIASKNLNIIMLQNRQNFGPGVDAYSIYRNQMKMKDENNNAYLFLSNEPGKGLFGALNALGIKLPW